MAKNIIFSSIFNKTLSCLFLVMFIPNILFASDNILILRPMKFEYKALENGIKQYFGNNYNVISSVNCKNNDCLKKSIKENSPLFIVAMGEKTIINIKKELQTLAQNTPVFTIDRNYTHSKRNYSQNFYHLNYETPFSVYINKLKKDFKVSIKKVGVIHSKQYSTFKVSEYIKSSKNDDVQVFSKMVTTTNNSRDFEKEVEEAYENLCKINKVDVILILNDKSLLTKEHTKSCFDPLAQKYKTPVILPSKFYLENTTNFGTIAISPNLKETGRHIASKMNEVINNKSISKYHIPISYISYTRNVLGKISKSMINYGEVPPFSTIQVTEALEDTIVNYNDTAQTLEKIIDTVKEVDNNHLKVTTSEKVREPEVKHEIAQESDDKVIDNNVKVEDINKKESTSVEAVTFSGKYVKITVHSHPVSSTIDGYLEPLGIAKNGDIFPILEELPQVYKIQFFSQIGFIEKTSGEIIKPDEQEPNIITANVFIISAIAGSAFISITILIIAILIFKKKKIVIPKKKSCLIIASSNKKIRFDSSSNKKISLKKLFQKHGYHVEITKDLAHVNKVLLYYLPEIICIDWRFTINIRQIIYNMLSERSFNTNVNIIFYNTVHSKTISAKNKFTNSTYYFDNDVSVENIQEIMFPAEPTNHYKSLEGKIENNSLVEILQLLDNSQKTGSLYIEKDNHPYGVVFVSKGHVIYSATDTLHGEDAVFNMLSLKEGMFHFVEGKLPKQNNMSIAVMEVLMCHVKQIDENEPELPKLSI